MYRRFRLLPYVALLGVATLALGFLCLSAVRGADCTWYCETNPVCNDANQSCPTCDAGLGVSCSDYERVQYNPAGILIQRGVSGGSEEKIQGDQVICFQRGACGNGTWFIGAACPGGYACIGPVPAYCQYCTQVGNWNVSWVYNYRCSSANCGG